MALAATTTTAATAARARAARGRVARDRGARATTRRRDGLSIGASTPTPRARDGVDDARLERERARDDRPERAREDAHDGARGGGRGGGAEPERRRG